MRTYTLQIDGHSVEVVRDSDGKFIIPEHVRGTGTALKPAHEPIVLARKPLSEGTVAANVLRWRTGALNIDACRVPGEPWKAHVATGLGTVKFFSEGDNPEILKYPHDAGRWPANIVLSYPEDTYIIRNDVDCTQRRELETWLAENA